jgi:pimeloyl-ACP methyl ester carboxylesterase
MNNIRDLPYSEIELDRFGNLVDPLSPGNIAPAEDLFVMVHGWNSDIDDARALYTNLFTQFSRTREAHAVRQPCAVLGVFWPSEKFAPPALIPGGAACLDTATQREFVASLRALLPDQPDDEGARELLTMDGADLLTDLEGGAAHIGNRLAQIRHSIEKLMNLATYHLMKERAGIVGRCGLARALDQIQDDYPGIRIHLAGHSFGCRAITAAAAAIRKPVASMTLFQAAFSHNSFSPPGGFRSVVTGGKCEGPILITHSVKDEAVGICYPIASRILRQSASSFGGANDRYGALGRNGARHTQEATDGDLLPEGVPYGFAPGRIYNLQADHIIQAHSDIVKPETAWALLSAAELDRARLAPL